MATYAWHAAGGGNSAATFFLLTASVGAVALRSHDRLDRIPAILTIAAGIVLLIINDAHGTAVLGGTVVGLLVAMVPGSLRTHNVSNQATDRAHA